MISIKLWIKLFWIANLFLGLLCCVMAYSVLFYARNKPIAITIPDIPEKPTIKETSNRTLEFFSDVWNIPVNTKPPAKIDSPTQPANWLQQLISRHITIKQIMTDDYAVVIVDNNEQLIEPKKTTNINDPVRRWQLTLEGRLLTILKILPGRGIKFEADKQFAWLEPKEVVPTKSGNQVNPVHQEEPDTIVKVAPNQWEVSAQTQQEIALNYDEYIQELSPESTGQGLKIRRLYENSKAAQVGLQVNDVITSVNAFPIRSMSQIPELIRQNQRQKQVVVEVLRNSQRLKFTFQIK